MGNFTPCRIGVWGVFDGDAFADALIPFVLRRELTARLPQAQIRMSAPYGFLRPTPRDNGEPAEPLGRWSPDRASAMASGLDCILVACTDPPPDHDSLARAYGVDRADLDALDVRRWFVDRAGLAPELCPVMRCGTDPAVLAPRLFSADLLAKRIEYLWLMGWYPPEGATVLVEGDAGLLPMVPALAAALGSLLGSEPDVTVVLAEMGSPGDAEFAAALAAQLPAGSVYRLPRCAGLEDLAAAIVNCAVFAGS